MRFFPSILSAILLGLAGLLVAAPAGLSGDVGENELPKDRLCVVFSTGLFTDVNKNDAIAAMQVWIDVLLKGKGIPVEAETRVYERYDQIAEGMKAGEIDAVGLLTHEYLQLEETFSFGRVYATAQDHGVYEEFAVLVREDDPAQTLEDLKGRSLYVHSGPRSIIAPMWLDRELHSAYGIHLNEFFSLVKEDTKVSKALLPVFFGKADACLVSVNGFDVMSELNPQVEKKLRVLATSEAIIPAILAFSSDYTPSSRDEVFANVDSMHDAPEGQQVLNLFFSERLVQIESEDLDVTRAMVSPQAGEVAHP